MPEPGSIGAPIAWPVGPLPDAAPSGAAASKPPDLSIILPVYNERESLPPLIAEIHAALRGTPHTYEILLVDDGSTDGSADVIRTAALESSNVTGIARSCSCRDRVSSSSAKSCGSMRSPQLR